MDSSSAIFCCAPRCSPFVLASDEVVEKPQLGQQAAPAVAVDEDMVRTVVAVIFCEYASLVDMRRGENVLVKVGKQTGCQSRDRDLSRCGHEYFQETVNRGRC